METTYLQSIIVKFLAVLDGTLGHWATEPTFVQAGGHSRLCCSLTDAGCDFCGSLAAMVTYGVDMFNGLFVALGAGS